MHPQQQLPERYFSILPQYPAYTLTSTVRPFCLSIILESKKNVNNKAFLAFGSVESVSFFERCEIHRRVGRHKDFSYIFTAI